MVLLGNSVVPPPTLDEVVNQTRDTYRGPLVAGEDLISFEIGVEIKVRRFGGEQAANRALLTLIEPIGAAFSVRRDYSPRIHFAGYANYESRSPG